jgi:predicted transcriptional regulator
MQPFTHHGTASLLRLIVELRGSDMPSNDVFLAVVSEREPDTLTQELAELQRAGLISWSEGGEQWTPTMRGLLIGIGLPAFEPGEPGEPGEQAAPDAQAIHMVG